MNNKLLFSKIEGCIQDYRDVIIETGDHVYRNPETGFKEFGTARYIAERFRELGLECTTTEDIPAVKVTVDSGRPGPVIAVLGELDSIICSGHPHCSSETGAVHACGHNAQLAALIGACAGIVKSGVMEKLSGRIYFIAVPAEEYIEIAYRKGLREKGTIRYLGGKPELVYRGWFDDVDISMMVHSYTSDKKVGLEKSSNGCIAKIIRYLGKASHAGGSPQNGINALYAANLGIMAVNSIRETFTEDDTVRVHPIITKGGDIVNVIPDDVHIETFVRGRTIKSILEANRKVNRALVGGAVSLGAKVEIEDIPGYMPLKVDSALNTRMEHIAVQFCDENDIQQLNHTKGSTDLGDLSTLMPVIQPYVGGCSGGLHTAEFSINDKDIAYVLGAKLLACLAADLLCGEGEAARRIIESYQPEFITKKEYLDFMDSLYSKKLFPVNDPME